MRSESPQLLPETQVFVDEMEEARKISKGPELFWRTAPVDPQGGEIRILRRWNSHTPSMFNVWGGGYFIRWCGQGTIVDPGCSFIRLFQGQTSYGLGDIHMVIVTHDHIDHCQDFGTLISLFRGYNQWRDERGQPPRTWDLVMSHGVADQFGSLLVHPENAPFLRWSKILPSKALPPSEVKRVHPIPRIARGKTRKDMANWEPYIVECSEFYRKEIVKKYKYHLHAMPTVHRELLGEHTGMGLRFTLTPGNKTLVISGDTGITDKSDLEHYKGANLLILHVGTMEKPGEPRLEEHLGLGGVVKILAKLEEKRERPQLVVLTEWGYEFGRLQPSDQSLRQLGGRSHFTILVEGELRKRGCSAYFAAVSGAKPGKNQQTPIIPADVDLRIHLPDFKVWSEDKKDFVSAAQIRAEEKAERIIFR